MRGFIDHDKVAAFWDDARRGAAAELQTGYLQDEWPAALGRNRFRGEWRDVSAWLDRLAVPAGRCLDVGCGVGVWLERLAGRFAHADGIDLSSEMVASAAARLAAAGVTNVSITTRSVTDLDDLADDQRYDLIFVGGVLMYLNDEDVDGMVARLARLLTPDGVLVLRESTSSPAPWYRDTPLGRGLFGDPSAPRPPYYAIYRTPPSYRAMVERQSMALVRSHPNRHYKLADLTEGWLSAIDKLTGGALRRRPARAERVAGWIHALRPLTLWPAYYAIRTFAPRAWKVNNWWYVARPARPALGG